MAINYITVKGYLKDGKIEVDLPENALEGEVELRVAVEGEMESPAEPLTGAEIVARGLTGTWKDLGIDDSVAWVEEQKRKRRERHQWQQD